MRVVLAIAFFISGLCLQAQRYVFMQWGTDDGLPTSTINDITEDPLGFIWLATDGAGLVRFDGNNFTQPISPDSLPSPFITVLETDETGNFWIGTENGPAFYNGRQLKLFEIPEGLKTRINAIAVSTPNEVYLASRNGLYLYDGKHFARLPETEGQEVFSVAIHQQTNMHHRVAYTTANGLGGDLKTDSSFLAQHGAITKIFSRGDEWLDVTAQGVFSSSEKRQISTLPAVRDVLMSNGSYWLAGASGGIEIVSSTGSMFINSQNGLSFDRVRCLYQAKNGSIWVGSLSGLSKLSSQYLTIYTQNQGLADERIHASLIDDQGNTWMGTASGVSMIGPKTLTNYTTQNGLPPGLVLAIAQSKTGEIWVGTEGGVARLKNNRFEMLPLQDPFVFTLAADEGGMYIGTAQGLYEANGTTISPVDGIETGIVQLYTHGNSLLGVSLDGQLFMVENGKAKRLTRVGDIELDTLRIRQVAGQTDNFLALVAEGLGVYVCGSESCTLINTDDGLVGNSIKAIAAGESGLWLGTDRGLQYAPVVNGNPGTLRLFDENSGFLAKECNERSLYISQEGVLLAGTNSGLYRIQAQPFVAQPETPIYITAIDLLFNTNTNWKNQADSLAPWVGIPKALRLAADQNYLTFHFASPAGTKHPGYVRYILEGQDKSWTVADGRQEAIYTDINPGTYTFRVQLSASPNFTDPEVAEMAVVIVPPFYRTWWFWTLIVFALGAIAFFAVRYRINQLNARLALETALADSERKALRLQMNPHFVFNALDAISGFIFKNEPKEAVKYLTSFAKLMRLTLESSRQTTVPLQNELQLLKNYIALEQLRFGHSFEYAFEVDDDVDPYEVNIPPMLLQPFVENAILHGLRHKKEGEGMLIISFTLNQDKLLCMIRDNGVGREKSRELNAKRGKSSLATSITEERIALLSKSLGQPVSFEIVDLKDEAGTATGTEVRITFPQLASDEDA